MWDTHLDRDLRDACEMSPHESMCLDIECLFSKPQPTVNSYVDGVAYDNYIIRRRFTWRLILMTVFDEKTAG